MFFFFFSPAIYQNQVTFLIPVLVQNKKYTLPDALSEK